MGNYKATLRGKHARQAYADTIGESENRNKRLTTQAVAFVTQSRKLKKGFDRGVPVALKSTPEVRIGEVITPPALRTRKMLVRLDRGSSKMFSVMEVVVYEDPSAE